MQWNAAYINQLSPAEKYDLVIQTRDDLKAPDWLLTANVFTNTGEEDVDTWWGICHGWAPAALVEPRPGPQAVVNIPDPASENGTIPLTFYSSDIRALMSDHYARNLDRVVNGVASSHLLGSRCYDSVDNNQEVDGEKDACFDVNPGSWHKSVVHWVLI